MARKTGTQESARRQGASRRTRARPSIDPWGVSDRYCDATGQWHEVESATIQAIRSTMGDGCAPIDEAALPLVVPRGQRLNLPHGSRIRLEDGGCIDASGPSAPELPLGYHDIESRGGAAPRRLIVTPLACYLPDDLFEWGWAVQVYSLRSAENWGIGDLADLARLGSWATGLGAGFLLINPLGANPPVVPQESSPYSAGSRAYRNLLYLRIEDVPGADRQLPAIQAGFAAAADLRRRDRIDRDRIYQLKTAALKSIWQAEVNDAAFERFESSQGVNLVHFSRYCALAERYGRNWRAWPAEYRRPDSPGVERFAAEHVAEVRFFAWVQWLLDQQLKRAAQAAPLMQDYPVGVSGDGAEAWMYQDRTAQGAAIGAPPDPFNRAGQNWGLQPFVPHSLRTANYDPFIQSVRGAMRHASALRIDHVMGLFRLFWIPHGAKPGTGAYVYYAAPDLLGILALESHRARCFVVGEDLGTVDPAIRTELASRKILTSRVVWLEAGVPDDFPRHALASIGSHDLPTIAGLWTGQDELDERQAGVVSDAQAWARVRARLQNQTGLSPDAPAVQMVLAAYHRLAAAPCMAVTASLEDALAIPHRPNMPGTVDTWPNWSVPLPVSLEELEHCSLAQDIATELNSRVKPLAQI
ncbi:MAG: 4-alpha-glucanotransferase [Planctomycetia bacterium]|nr:4-alpha-glucanotransferase [Planctomycetia bacterium]